jgi:hypothetical protein
MQKGHLYIIQSEEGPVKIGISINPDHRIASIETGSGRYIVRQFVSPAIPAYDELEKEMHRHYQDKRLRGEWFSIDYQEAVRLAHRLGAAAHPEQWKVSEAYVRGALHRDRLAAFIERNPSEAEEQAFLLGMGDEAREQIEFAEYLDLKALAETMTRLHATTLNLISADAILGTSLMPPLEITDEMRALRSALDHDLREADLKPA